MNKNIITLKAYKDISGEINKIQRESINCETGFLEFRELNLSEKKALCALLIKEIQKEGE